MTVFIKLNIQPLYDPAIPLLGIYLREMKTCVHKKICTRMFIVPLFIMSPNGNNPHVHNRKFDEQIVAFLYNEIIKLRNNFIKKIITY